MRFRARKEYYEWKGYTAQSQPTEHEASDWRELNQQSIDFNNIQIFRCYFININVDIWREWKDFHHTQTSATQTKHNFNSILIIIETASSIVLNFKHPHIILKLKCGLCKWNFSPLTLKHPKHPVSLAQQHHLSFEIYARAATFVSTIPTVEWS